MFFDSRQMSFDFIVRADEEYVSPAVAEVVGEGDDDPLVTAPMVRRTVDAATARREKCRAPTSVFDLAHRPVAVKLEGHDTRAAIYRTSTLDGVTRCVRVREQETEEWQEKETARRARQKPPRPPRQKFKMRNSRVWSVEQK